MLVTFVGGIQDSAGKLYYEFALPFLLTMMKENPFQRDIQPGGHEGMSVDWL